VCEYYGSLSRDRHVACRYINVFILNTCGMIQIAVHNLKHSNKKNDHWNCNNSTLKWIWQIWWKKHITNAYVSHVMESMVNLKYISKHKLHLLWCMILSEYCVFSFLNLFVQSVLGKTYNCRRASRCISSQSWFSSSQSHGRQRWM
jgi:hypothetical protein